MEMYEKYITDGQSKDIFGFNVGDKLYVANTEKGKVYEFLTDCIKIHDRNTTVHGYIYGLYGKWGTPTEYSLKWLNKRCLFIKKKDAKEWLENRLSKKRQLKVKFIGLLEVFMTKWYDRIGNTIEMNIDNQ